VPLRATITDETHNLYFLYTTNFPVRFRSGTDVF
jgi:hypothetical protein